MQKHNLTGRGHHYIYMYLQSTFTMQQNSATVWQWKTSVPEGCAECRHSAASAQCYLYMQKTQVRHQRSTLSLFRLQR